MRNLCYNSREPLREAHRRAKGAILRSKMFTQLLQ